jgi:hypothetical protein
MLDGNVILNDDVMDLDVDVEEKLHFIFDTFDPNKTQEHKLFNYYFKRIHVVIGIDFDQFVKICEVS